MTVIVAATEDLTASVRSAVIDVCIAAHENDDFANLFTYIESGGRHFLGYQGSELASHAVVTTRWLQAGGRAPWRTAFVDAVSTRPSLQGQGHATAVMARLAASIDDYDIGCLQTDIPGFYERLAWEVWRGPLGGRSEEGMIPTPLQTGVMVLRLPRTPSLDLETQLTIERQPTRIWE